MSIKSGIWMPVYIGDYLADTGHLDAEKHGAYFLLLMHHWKKGSIPTDQNQLRNIARVDESRWPAVWKTLSGFFSEQDGVLIQGRLCAELEKAQRRIKSKVENGLTGAIRKWGTKNENFKLDRAERLANARRLARHSAAEWHTLILVCGSACVKCGDTGELVKDHVLPIYQGGSDGIENIQPLCRHCNAGKGGDSTDFRPTDWRERLAERLAKPLANGSLTPAPSPSPLPCEEQKQKPSAKAMSLPFVVPSWIDPEIWSGFEEMRKKIRAPLTDKARKGIIADLEKLCETGDSADAVLQQSINNAYRGVFQLKQKTNGGSNGARREEDDEVASLRKSAAASLSHDGYGEGSEGGLFDAFRVRKAPF